MLKNRTKVLRPRVLLLSLLGLLKQFVQISTNGL